MQDRGGGVEGLGERNAFASRNVAAKITLGRVRGVAR